MPRLLLMRRFCFIHEAWKSLESTMPPVPLKDSQQGSGVLLLMASGPYIRVTFGAERAATLPGFSGGVVPF